jgi:Asp-tRNA(Asn)/Glu-tRNA(Gln) amidotransferase A subunit family amidase
LQIAKNVEDAEILFDVIKGKDIMDSNSYEETKKIDKKIDVKNLKIGVVKECLGDGIQKEVADITKNTIKKLRCKN